MENTEGQVKEALLKLPLLKSEIAKVIVGQEQAIDQLLVAFLAGGHALLEGVPGLAKTLLVKTLSEATFLDFRRIQFTPDLMPSDIIGTEILEEDHASGKRFFKFNKGPLFSNIVLADEINRTPPKTQAALLEAMQEYAVSYAGNTYLLPKPFFILATQNPIEQGGTYPLPEAQLDRFLLLIKMGYPEEAHEIQILTQTTGEKRPPIQSVLKGEEIQLLQDACRKVFIGEQLISWVARMVRATRPDTTTLAVVKEHVRWGAGPRAGQALIVCAKAHALLHGRFAVNDMDIKAVAPAVLRHRILLSFRAEAEGYSPDVLVKELVQSISI